MLRKQSAPLSHRRLSGPLGARPPAAWTAALLRSIPRRLTARRPAIAWTLSLLFTFKGLVCLATVAYPISAREPVTLVAFTGVVAIVAAYAIWLFGSRIPLLGFELFAVAGSLTTSWIVTHAATAGGMMVAAFAYPWIAIYAAHFFPRRAVLAQGLLISVGFGAGLLLGGLSHVVIYWIIVTATIWSICLLLGKLNESLRLQADTDHLTGLLNRSGLLAAAKRERALADRTGSPLTLAVLDLDGFKQINDREGHAAGDRLLAALGRDWRACVRPGDILARHGGDEFVLLLPCTTPTGAEAVLERLRCREGAIGWSVGVSEWLPGESLDAPLARADRYLYGVKDALRVEDVAASARNGDYVAHRALLHSI
ncbi:MAG TPA: GGDEF domain-containing protein [Solirubrobacteraceae bacterium]|nr:GGDEF domain-containing protein [Solirubrobacteraceae bacterium]